MSTDTDLTRSLHQAAERAPVPAVDVDRLRAGGRRLVRRRRAAVVAAALVLGIVGGGTLLGPGLLGSDSPGPVKRDHEPVPVAPQIPPTVADLPQGEAPALPYVVGDVVHVGGGATDLGGSGLGGLRYGGAVTLGWDAGRGVVEIGSRGSQRVLDPDATGYPAVSLDGRWAAWPVVAEGEDARVVVWSFETGRAVDGFTVPEQPQCCDSGFRIAGVGDDAQVLIRGDQAVYVHEPDSGDARAAKGLSPLDDVVLVNEGGVIVRTAPTDKSGEGSARLGTIEGERFHPTLEHQGGDLAGSSWWSPYVTGVFVFRAPGGGIRTWSLESGPDEGPQTVAVPASVDVTDVVWESADAMLVQATEDGHTWWLRCSIDSGRCERAADLGEQGLRSLVITPTR